MKERYDIIIAGAGCAGLSFAWHLLEAGIEGKEVLVVDQSFERSADRLWCFWGDDEAHFTEIAAQSWRHAAVRFDDQSIDEELEALRYHCVRSEDFRALVLDRLEASEQVTLLQADIVEIAEDAEGAFVQTSEGICRADWVAQSVRHLGDEGAKAPRYPVRQHFGGLEIQTDAPVFDPDTFTMMDFRVPQRDGVAFVYVLPFAEDKALIEHTMFSTNPLDTEAHLSAARDYLDTHLESAYTLTRTESGCLPMDDRYPAQQSSPSVFNIGIVGGQMKPSTGYAFQRIQRHTERLAQGYAERSRLTPLPSASPRFRFYDLLLLKILHDTPERGRDIFRALFQKGGVSPVLRFLDEKTSLIEELKLVIGLPWAPFVRGIPRGISDMRRTRPTEAPKSLWPGLSVAFIVLALWAASMVLGLSGAYPAAGHWAADLGWIALQTFLSTGVFITAHDAMHGLIAPGRPGMNRMVGWLATWSYAGLNYDALHRAHHRHHAEPATDADPDYHQGSPNLVRWYVDFMRQYLSWGQFAWLCVLLSALLFVFAIPPATVALFWALPLILSTLQLFIVGTWLPHRPGTYLGDGPLRARSVDLPPALSLLACYHFGYHFEHHARPDLPWWRLWRVRGLRV